MRAKGIRNQEGKLILNTGIEIQPKKYIHKITLVSKSLYIKLSKIHRDKFDL